MTTLLPPPAGGSPERRGNPALSNEIIEGDGKLEIKLLGLQRAVGIAACDFMAAVSFNDPFRLVFMIDSDYGKIAEEAVLRALGTTPIPEEGQYHQVYRQQQEEAIRAYIQNYSPDNPFKDGVKVIKDLVVASRPYIAGKMEVKPNPNGYLNLGNVHVYIDFVNRSLQIDPTGLKLVRGVGDNLVMANSGSKREGLALGTDMFSLAVTHFTEAQMPEFLRLGRNLRFLRVTDNLLARLDRAL